MQAVLDNPKVFLKATDKRVIDKIKSFLPVNLRKNAPKLMIYLINSPKTMSILFKHSLYSVILPSRFIQSHFDALYKMKDEGIEQLISFGIISRSNYRRGSEDSPGLCREYNINPEILLEMMLFASNLDLCLNVAGNEKIPVTIPERETPTHLLSPTVLLNPESLLYGVMSHVFHNTVSIRDIEQYCVNRYKDLLKRKNKLLIRNPKRYYSEVASIASDYHKYTSLLLRGYTDNTGVFQYTKKFILTSTGRVCEVGGGLQGLSRGCKAYMYGSNPNIYNYDIRACQLVLLSSFAKQLDIDTSWIDQYVSNDINKKAYARLVGISTDAWKKTILSMVFGGMDNRFGSPFETILKEKGGNKKAANEAFVKWKTITEGLRIICKLWLTRLRKFAKSKARENILENAVGVQISLKDKGISRKFLSSFLLQGLESRIISELILYPDKDFKVISPEYDGIVVEGRITNTVWKDVLTKVGLADSGLMLENKPFN